MSRNNNSKILMAVLVLIVAGAAWYGYSKQTEQLTSTTATGKTEMVAEEAPAPDAPIFKRQKGDVLYGKADAPVTIIDYSSLSCPHCAHFHSQVLPQLEKEFINTGKVKLLFRHFPLNAPALRAAQLVNCVPDTQQQSFLKVLFDMQAQWAFNEGFMDQLRQIAAVGGMDSAAFDSCIADKDGEARVVNARRKGADQAQVNATPSFFINGVKLNESPEIDAFRDALKPLVK